MLSWSMDMAKLRFMTTCYEYEFEKIEYLNFKYDFDYRQDKVMMYD